mgnify:FL=1
MEDIVYYERIEQKIDKLLDKMNAMDVERTKDNLTLQNTVLLVSQHDETLKELKDVVNNHIRSADFRMEERKKEKEKSDKVFNKKLAIAGIFISVASVLLQYVTMLLTRP